MLYLGTFIGKCLVEKLSLLGNERQCSYDFGIQDSRDLTQLFRKRGEKLSIVLKSCLYQISCNFGSPAGTISGKGLGQERFP